MAKTFMHRKKNSSDFVETPYSMTRQLIEHEDFSNPVWEPACGNGAIAKILIQNNFDCFSSDVNLSIKWDAKYFDFCNTEYILFSNKDIITNPPYSKLDEFIIQAKKYTKRKIAFLCRLFHLQGLSRFNNNVYSNLKTVYIFIRQADLRFNDKYQALRKDGKYPAGGYVYAWFVWDMEYKGKPQIEWINNQEYILGKINV